MNTTAITFFVLTGLFPRQAEVPVQFESSTFTISVNGVEVGTEEFSVSPNADGVLARGRTRLRVGTETVEAESTMQLDRSLRPESYEYRSEDRVVRFSIGDRTTEVTAQVDGRPSTMDIRFDSRGAILDDNFFHHYMLLLYRLGADGGSVPALVPQQMTLGTFTVRPTGENTYEMTTDSLRLEATTDREGRMVRLSVPDANVVVER